MFPLAIGPHVVHMHYMKLRQWLEHHAGGDTEARELAESLVTGTDRAPSVEDEPALCAAAKSLLNALDRSDTELERVGYGE
jgi:hypothetical protein